MDLGSGRRKRFKAGRGLPMYPFNVSRHGADRPVPGQPADLGANMKQQRCAKCDGRIGPKARECPHCGHEKPTEEQSQLTMLLAILAVFMVLLLFMSEKHGLPKATVAEQAEPVSQLHAGHEMIVLERLKRAYPDLRGERLHWKEFSGRRCLAIPDGFWRRLKTDDKLQLVAELDVFFDSRNWQIVTGRYTSDRQFNQDKVHPRSQLMVGF